MSNIEPTEEQKQAAATMAMALLVSPSNAASEQALARLLAEREAKLREEWKRQASTNFGFAVTLDKEVTALREEVTRLEALCTEEARLIVERDALRARVAELEAEVAIKDEERTMQVSMIQSLRNAREAQHLARIAELETVYESYREARARIAKLEDANGLDEVAHLARISELYRDNEQHLADIKALMAKVRVAERMRKVVVRVVCSPSTITGVSVPLHLIETLDALNRDEADFADVLARLAHYDDAKAAEGGEG